MESDVLQHARDAFDRRDWAQAFDGLVTADSNGTLEAADLERLAIASKLTGRDDQAADGFTRAHQAYLESGDTRSAVRNAFHLGMGLMQLGDHAQGGGWLGRAQRLLEEADLDCPECGLVLIPMVLQALQSGEPAQAHELSSRAYEIGRRFGDADAVAFGRLGTGQALIEMGQTDEGLSMLDEAMVAVTAGETSPIVSGIVYCAVIEACQLVLDYRRATEWTSALSRWCDDQPGLVMFRGQCLVHRCQIMQLRGEWPDALEEVRRARERLSDPPGQPAIGAALYEQAELHRLRGEFAKAEASYREANQWGRSPQPGLAQLRLAQGQVEAATASVQRCLDEATSPIERSRLLPVAVEVFVVAGRLDEANQAAQELAALAGERNSRYLHAIAAACVGAVLLATGDASGALVELRRALAAWAELDALHEGARTRALIGVSCRALGDADTADMELSAARRVLEQLGAAPAIAWLDRLTAGEADRATPGGLSGRELEVLRLVAAGKTNRAIAAELIISEKTVARHVSNIFAKLGVPSRAAATAYAYEHDLV